MPVIVSPEQFCEELIRDVPFSQALVNTFDRYARGPKPYEDDLGRGRGLVGQTESGYALRLNHERGYNPFESTELLLCADDSEKSSMDERILQHYLSNLVRVSFAYSNKGQGSININGTHIALERTPILLSEPNLETSYQFGRFVYEVRDEAVKELTALRSEEADRQVQEMFHLWHRSISPFHD